MTGNGNGKTQEFTFDDQPAVRDKTPLLVGLVGPSGCGKTYSALRLAAGIQKVLGGDIRVIDTEAKRSKHYAYDEKTGKGFKFRHVPLTAPFSPQHYLAALRHCVSSGSRVIVIDSMSHEHEGVGGVLEWHAREQERLLKTWKGATMESTNFPAWNKPKEARRELINEIVTTFEGIACVFCFRAKNKLKLGGKGEKPVKLGWMPIAGEEFVYEMTVNLLLPPGSRGRPDLHPESDEAKMVFKVPGQFTGIFGGGPLDENIGETMARWAAGESVHVEGDAGTAAPAGPVFHWRTSPDWNGQPLSSAPLEVLREYRGMIDKALDTAKGNARTSLNAWAQETNRAIEDAEAEAALGGEPEDDGVYPGDSQQEQTADGNL